MTSTRAATTGVLLLCFAITLGLRLRMDTMHPGGAHWDEPADHHKYLYMAEHPLGSFHIQPTCWRIGVPALAKILPFSTYRNFDVLSVFFLGLCGWMIYLWLLAVRLDPHQALLGVLMFYSLGGAGKALIGGVTSPDPASYFFIVLALYAIFRESDLLCAAALVLGVLTKETVLLIGPLHYALRAGSWWDSGRFRRTVLVCLPCVCVFAAVRILIPAWNDRDSYVQSLPFIYTQVSAGMVKYDLLTAFRGTMQSYAQLTPINLLRALTYGTLGVHLFLPFLAPRSNRELLLRWTPYWLPVLLSLLIALNPERRVSSLFPMLILMGLNGIGVLAAILRLRILHFQVWFAMLLGLLLLKKDVGIVPFDLVAAVSLCWLCYAVVRYQRSTPAIPPLVPAAPGEQHTSDTLDLVDRQGGFAARLYGPGHSKHAR